MEKEITSQRYFVPVMGFLLEKRTIRKYDLTKIIKSSNTLDKLVNGLEKDGYITIKEEIVGRRTYEISLTEKGREVAEQLKRVAAAAKGMKFTFPDKFGIITLLDASEKLTMDEIADTYPDPASILRELESLKLIKQTIDTSQYPMKNYFSLTEKGKNVADKLKEIDNLIKS